MLVLQGSYIALGVIQPSVIRLRCVQLQQLVEIAGAVVVGAAVATVEQVVEQQAVAENAGQGLPGGFEVLQPVEQGAVPAALQAGMVLNQILGGLVHGIDKQQ